MQTENLTIAERPCPLCGLYEVTIGSVERRLAGRPPARVRVQVTDVG